MKKNRNLVFYIGTIVAFSALIYFFIRRGTNLQAGRAGAVAQHINTSAWQQFHETLVTTPN